MSVLFPFKEKAIGMPLGESVRQVQHQHRDRYKALVICGHFLQELLSSHDVRHSKIKSIKLACSLRLRVFTGSQ